MARRDASGFVDYSLLQATKQYSNVLAALEYENNYGFETGMMGNYDGFQD